MIAVRILLVIKNTVEYSRIQVLLGHQIIQYVG